MVVSDDSFLFSLSARRPTFEKGLVGGFNDMGGNPAEVVEGGFDVANMEILLLVSETS